MDKGQQRQTHAVGLLALGIVSYIKCSCLRIQDGGYSPISYKFYGLACGGGLLRLLREFLVWFKDSRAAPP